MNKSDLVKKMEEYVGAYRRQLELNDGSSVQALSNQVKSGLSSLKNALKNNESTTKTIDSIHGYTEKLEQAAKSGDRKLSAKTLELMEKAVASLKDKSTDDDAGDSQDQPQS